MYLHINKTNPLLIILDKGFFFLYDTPDFNKKIDMNIFFTDSDLAKCARDHDDKRLNKMIIETAQIASTALWINNCDLAETLYSQHKIYLPSHENHPITKWCSSHVENFFHTISFLVELLFEYTLRFSKTHGTYRIFDSLCDDNVLWSINTTGNSSRQPNCTTHHKHIKDIHEAYRQELVLKWSKLDKHTPKWTNRNVPDFYQEYLNRR